MCAYLKPNGAAINQIVQNLQSAKGLARTLPQKQMCDVSFGETEKDKSTGIQLGIESRTFRLLTAAMPLIKIERLDLFIEIHNYIRLS